MAVPSREPARLVAHVQGLTSTPIFVCYFWYLVFSLRDFRLSPHSSWELRISVIKQRVVVISYRRFGTTYRAQSSGCKNKKILNPEHGTDRCPETSVRNYHYSLCNSPQQRGSYFILLSVLFRDMTYYQYSLATRSASSTCVTSLGISAAIHVCLGIFCWYSGWRARIRRRVHAQFERVRVIAWC